MAPSSTVERIAQRMRAFARTDRQPIRAEIPAVGGDARTAVIRLYEPIDDWGEWWGVSAREFTTVLDGLPDSVEEIRLLINSPGGMVWEGLAILNALRSHRARVVAVVEGMAASAASFIACGVDELEMAPNSELFVHCAWGLCVGNAMDMAKMAEDLGHEDRNIASIYQAKAGGTLDEWLAAMAAETYYSAEEAVAAGLADRVGAEPASDEAKNRFDRSMFNTAGRATPARASATSPSQRPEGQKGGSVPELTSEQLALLGLAEDATQDTIDARLGELVDAATAPPPAEPVELPEGVVAIDAAQLEQLRQQAAAGVEARNEQMRQHREQLVQAAVADGRIPPARREHWLNQLEVDPGSEQVLAGLQKGLIPVDGPIGSNGAVDLDSDDAFYAQLFGKEALTNG